MTTDQGLVSEAVARATEITNQLLAFEDASDSAATHRERVRIITATRVLVETQHAELTEAARLLAREIAPDLSQLSVAATAKAEALADFYAAWRNAIDPQTAP